MSKEETESEIDTTFAPLSMKAASESINPTENALKNEADSSDENSIVNVSDSDSKILESENPALISSEENEDSKVKVTETENVPAEPGKCDTESHPKSSIHEVEELQKRCLNVHSPCKDSKPVAKIKVLIKSVDKSFESVKSSQITPSVVPIENSENEKPDGNLETSQQDINNTENTQTSEQYAENVTYTEDGTAIYIDPKTQHKYKWCQEKNSWIAFDEQETNPTANKASNPYENEHYRWCCETNQWIPKNTEQTSNLTETEHYRWDAQKKEWIMKNQLPSLDDVTYGYENGVRIYTDKDGMVFFWDEDKKAWFPKIDDDFLAKYQMSYGFIDNTTASVSASVTATATAPAVVQEEQNKIELQKEIEQIKKNDAAVVAGVKRKAPPEPPKWFEVDETQNTKVYVSNLPLDITMEEFSEIMSKCGMIMKDPQTQKQKLKLYTEPDGQLKGDGLCDYIKVESVDLALKLLDDSIVRGNKIKVQRAKFQMRGEYNPSLKPKKKKKDKEKLIKMKEKLFDWRPEKMRGERSKHERTVIIKNLFSPELFDKEVQLIIDYQNDLRDECSKCGTVRKVVIYDRHPEGVAQVNMADPEQADLVIQMMNGRFFGQRKLTAETWDGKTKYKIAETEEEIQARINKWDKYLEKDGTKEQDEDEEECGDATKKLTDNEKIELAPTA